MSKKTPVSKATPPDFENVLTQLESLVEQLESGKLGLSDSLSRFEQGVALSRQCHDLLEQARLKVSQLTHPEDPESGQDFMAKDSS